ncbi:MAG: GH25 family lysozyme, partial [Candidatus Angelobacter sp.]
MTIFYPDVSNYQAGLTIQPSTVAVCAKASEGTTYYDTAYVNFAFQAAAQGSFFFAYHFLHHSNVDAQAGFCHAITGSTPIMIDCESPSDNPTVADCVEFAQGIRARGGVCTLVYLPHWYWQGNLGSPDLTPFAQAGLSLVSSDYTTYSDTGPGWNPYGGLTPVIWQYTDSFPYGGQSVDFNAYRGTVAQLMELVT